MPRTFDIPFNDGQDEGVDRVWLPDGKFSMLRNCRLARDGRLEVRPQYTALANTLHAPTAPGNTFVPHDVSTYEDQLLAFGAPSAGAPAYPRELYTLVQTTGGVWKGVSDNPLFVNATVPTVQNLTTLFSSPYDEVITSSDIAYVGGYLCVVRANATAGTGRVYVLNATTGALLGSTSVASVRSLRVIASGTSFIVGAKFNNGNISAATILAGTTFAMSAFTALEAGVANDTFTWDLSPVLGTTDFVVSYARTAANTTRVRRYTAAFGLTWTFDIAATRGNSAVIAQTAATAGVLLGTQEAGNFNLRLLNIATGVLAVGPTTILGGGQTGTPALTYVNATQARVLSDSAGDFDLTYTAFDITLATLATGSSTFVRNARHVSKGIALPVGTTSECYYIGTCVASGNVAGTDQTYSTCIRLALSNFIPGARWNYGIADRLVDANATNHHGRPSIATDGAGTYFSTAATLDEDTLLTQGAGYLQVTRWVAGIAVRHQTAESGGAMYIAGGSPGYYDGSSGIVEQGFPQTPVISSIGQLLGGALTPLATYTYVAVYEWVDGKGRLHRSTPSAPFSVTLTGANNQTSLNLSSNEGQRWAGVNLLGGVKTVVYRTTPNDSILFRAVAATATPALGAGIIYTVGDGVADTVVQTKPVLYTISQKPIANVAPLPHRFVASGKDRIVMAGHPDPYLVTFSQVAFPAEPLEGASSNNFSFQIRMPQPVTGVAVVGTAYRVFTGDAIYDIPGNGPQRNGSGEFLPPMPLDTDVGCIDWRSIVVTGAGVFFQGAPDKIYLQAAGAPTFVGQPVRDTLAAFPVITGAALCTTTQQVVFSCTTTNGSTGVLLVYDTRRGVWSVDDVGPVTAVVEYLGRLALLSAGAVSLEEAGAGGGVGALPTMSVRTGVMGPFQKNGNGDLCKVTLSGTYLGDSTVEAFISYDDGKTWISMGQRALTAAALGVVAGDAVNQTWTPKKRTVNRFALRFDLTNGLNTGASRLHMVSLEVEADEFTARRTARDVK